MGFVRSAGYAGGAAVTMLGLVALAAGAQAKQAEAGNVPVETGSAPETITLEMALSRAAANEPAFVAATAEQRALELERKIARTALLPSATYHNQAIYTQANGEPASRIGQTTNAPSPIFIANNAVREYASQGVFNETLGVAQLGGIRLADANAVRAEAELEVARRGLVATVVSLYYGAEAGQDKMEIAEEALNEANQFVDLTQKREAAREAAHADVLKARLAQQQRQREVAEAQLARDKAHIELAVLLYPDPGTAYKLMPRGSAAVLPDEAAAKELAAKNNPELRSSLATVRISEADTFNARAALLPELALNFTYGIDATNFGVNGPDGIRNLGYSMSAQLDIPVWDWLATERKVKQARLREGAARVALTAAQRHLLANLAEFYAEASVANRQMASLAESVATARESLRLTRLRYVDGESSALEVVDAENSLIAAENAEIDGRTRYDVALANLQTLTGTL